MDAKFNSKDMINHYVDYIHDEMRKFNTKIYSHWSDLNDEMRKEDLASRMVAIDAMVDSKKMKLGNLTDDEWDRVIESIDEMAKAPIYIDDNSSITISDLRSKCRKLNK